MVTEAEVRKIALALPEASERASYGGCPSWRTAKGMFTWIREKPRALVVWVDSLDAKEILLAHEPEVFFTTSHYDGYPILLVRIEAVDAKRARAVIEESYRVRAPVVKAKRKSATKKPAAPAKKRAAPAKKRKPARG